ncbi:MAG TPA: XdhC family protein [Jatrophihabitantaceae bacterium]|jgi:xanthine dehydrogenase accessory factor
MPARHDLASRAAALTAAGTPFVWATVVRAARPTSAKPGDSAIVLGDGQLDGFVGGDCAEATVRAQALEVLAAGETRLLRIAPEDGPGEDGVVRVHNPCLSGGTLDIFLEPSVPLPLVLVYGQAPIATALLRADRMFGQQLRALATAETPLPEGVSAVIVASHGNDEVPVLSAALRAGIPYVGLVASRRRGPAVLAALPVDDALRARVHTPAGLDIGAHSPPEVALSILAEIVASRARPAADARRPAQPVTATAVDPVCGMTVAAATTSPHADTPDGIVYFCGSGCRAAYLDNPAAYATES